MNDFRKTPDEYREITRLHDIEHNVGDLKDDVTDIKTNINSLCTQIAELAMTMNTVVLKLEERDRLSNDTSNKYKDVFIGFGNKIDKLEEMNRCMELQLVKNETTEHKIGALEKVVYGASTTLLAAIGSGMLWLLQKQTN
jgi:regulator of replication initiation timing